jgi:hypothetical protein
MNVEQVTSLYESLRSIVAHFQCSVKSKEHLNKAMSVLELHKGLHQISWCATRMAHFLTACVKVNELMVPIYNTMYSMKLKEEERDKLFSVENIYTLKVIVDVQKATYSHYLRAVDKSSNLVSMSYNIAQTAANSVSNALTKVADEFLESLTIDTNGNFNWEEKLNGDSHSLRASNRRVAAASTTTARLVKKKEDCKKIKDAILKNLEDNIRDQMDDNTEFFGWSGLDLSDQTQSLNMRIERMNPLIDSFTSEHVQTVLKYKNIKETQVEANRWFGRKILLKFPAIIRCTKEELVEELQVGWPVLARMWQKEVEAKGRENVSQVDVIISFLRNPDSPTMYPHVCSLLKILLATPSNTSPLERSFSYLQMVCAPRRNQLLPAHLETLYLLAVLKIPVKTPAQYKKAVECLETMY